MLNSLRPALHFRTTFRSLLFGYIFFFIFHSRLLAEAFFRTILLIPRRSHMQIDRHVCVSVFWECVGFEDGAPDSPSWHERIIQSSDTAKRKPRAESLRSWSKRAARMEEKDIKSRSRRSWDYYARFNEMVCGIQEGKYERPLTINSKQATLIIVFDCVMVEQWEIWHCCFFLHILCNYR